MANLAVKVEDLDAACAYYERAGAEIRDRIEWNGAERADVFLGAVQITLFTRAIYEDAVALPPEGFLHPALFTDDQAVIGALSPFMLTLAIGQPFLQVHFTLAGIHRGAGDTVTPLLSAMVGNWLIRLPIALLLADWLEADVVWIWMTLIVDHVARTLWLGTSFVRGKWRDGRAAGRVRGSSASAT